jgi:hypothetical protein
MGVLHEGEQEESKSNTKYVEQGEERVAEVDNEAGLDEDEIQMLLEARKRLAILRARRPRPWRTASLRRARELAQLQQLHQRRQAREKVTIKK